MYGFAVAALAGALVAIFTSTAHTQKQEDQFFLTVKKMVLSDDRETRREGWANIDNRWNDQDILQLQSDLIQGSDEVILDAALAFAQRGIDPEKDLHLYAEALAPDLYDPLQSALWFEESKASPLKEWKPTLDILLTSKETPIRNRALSLAMLLGIPTAMAATDRVGRLIADTGCGKDMVGRNTFTEDFVRKKSRILKA